MKNPFLLVALLAAAPALVHAQFLTPPEALVLDGIPPIPASVAEGVGRYTDFRSAGLLTWNPQRREMLISTRFADAAQVHRVAMPGGARTQLTFFAERVADASFHPVRDNYFVFSKDVGGGEWFQNYRYDTATGVVTLLTDGKSRNSLGAWSRDGAWMAYESTRRNGTDADLYVIDPARPETNRLLAENKGGGWYATDWSPDGRTLLVLEYISINESFLWLFDATTGQRTLLTPKDGKEQVAYGDGEFSTDGKGLYVTTDLGSEFQRLAYLDLATRRYRFLAPDLPWDVETFDVSPDGRMIAFVANEDGIGKLHLLESATGVAVPVPALPTGIASGVQWHPTQPVLAFNFASARSPQDVYTLDVTTRTIERWTTSETGGLVTDAFREAELVKWRSFDGRMISGFLFRPAARFSGRRPVIINIHGGPEGQSRPGFQGRSNYYLNEMGIAILYPNIRGSSGYGKTFLKLDNAMLRADSYRDINALIDWIADQPDLDDDRILVTGGSYGGHATLAVATHYSERIRCAVDVVGMSNLVTFLERTESYRRDLRRAEYGDERDPKTRAYLESIAPMNLLQQLKKPLFVVQGQNDPRVPASESAQIVDALKRAQVPVWYLVARDEGHGFAKKRNQDFQFHATVAFMQQCLLGEPQ
jgi:dipeptidyl aminopeptidase/acylaminoacyl peptidase